ncbi:hypothetical protein [Methylophilus sp. DW102]|uniref:hypothetical protein n=1 Tax=Methylophilus sp. DW102 TaxID=3095607 RepID=UPI00308CBDF9|nr:hypothetical protein MTDW_12960 [Methylophilus sp. DW102]
MKLAATLTTVGVLGVYFGLQVFINHQEEQAMQASLSNNISAAIMQCLPEEIDEVCTIKLIEEDQRLKLVTERHATRHYGQPVKQPSVKYVVAMKD